MTPNTIPCGSLAVPMLVARVASTMGPEGMAMPSYEAQPGRCRFCGHPLPYAFSATSWVDDAIKRVEWNEADAVSAKLEFNEAGMVKFGNGVALVHRKDRTGVSTHTGLRHIGEHFPPILLAANGACEALTTDVFRQASVVVRTKATALRKALAVKESAKVMHEDQAAKKAARALAASMDR